METLREGNGRKRAIVRERGKYRDFPGSRNHLAKGKKKTLGRAFLKEKGAETLRGKTLYPAGEWLSFYCEG